MDRIQKVILQRDIEYAMANTGSNMEAAKFLNVSLNTYKKYAKQYVDINGIDLYTKHKNVGLAGVPKFKLNAKNEKYSLTDVLENRIPKYPLWKLKRKLIQIGAIKQQCELCGFNEVRVTDKYGPFALYQIDGNSDNYNLDNLQVLCFNCYYLTVGSLNYTHDKIKINENEFINLDFLEDIDTDEIKDLTPDELNELLTNLTKI